MYSNCRAKRKDSICLHYKYSYTAFWFCRTVLPYTYTSFSLAYVHEGGLKPHSFILRTSDQSVQVGDYVIKVNGAIHMCQD